MIANLRMRLRNGVLGYAASIVVALLCAMVSAGPAAADKIAHPKAVFSGLDKITGRIISFEVATNETVQFGSLQITERACYTRPATEAPQTITFAQVDEVDAKKQYKRIFSGWMFAASPGLNGIEHPVYDIWLTDCKGGTTVTKSPETAAAEPPAPPAAAPAQVQDQPTPEQQAKAERKRRRAEAAAARKRQIEQEQQDEQDPDLPPADVPRQDPGRAPPSRSFFPDAAGGRDPGGLY
jgi:hypothetical protein